MTVTCAACGTPVEPGGEVCPRCGTRNKAKLLVAGVAVSGSLSLKHQDKTGFVLLLAKIRSKLSRRGRPATESLTIDRTSSEKTVKKHFVTELVNGQVVVVHNEKEESPAKHRPPHQ